MDDWVVVNGAVIDALALTMCPKCEKYLASGGPV
jgi:hypothetical protein